LFKKVTGENDENDSITSLTSFCGVLMPGIVVVVWLPFAASCKGMQGGKKVSYASMQLKVAEVS